jgi:hypothetical protein
MSTESSGESVDEIRRNADRNLDEVVIDHPDFARPP